MKKITIEELRTHIRKEMEGNIREGCPYQKARICFVSNLLLGGYKKEHVETTDPDADKITDIIAQRKGKLIIIVKEDHYYEDYSFDFVYEITVNS